MNNTTESYQTSQYPVPFIRLETPRECQALPYATLLGLYLALDGNSLQLDFALYQVTVEGKRLHEVFCSISGGACAALFACSETDELELGPTSEKPVIREIRIKSLKP